MSQKLVIPLLAALAFGAGYGSRLWTERSGALTPPPSDFVAVAPTVNGTKAKPTSAEMRAKLLADIEKVRPQIEAYTKRRAEIEAEFERDFVAILTPEQKERRAAKQAERQAKNIAKQKVEAVEPITDERIALLQQSPLWDVLFKLACTWRLERDSKEHKLSGQQQQQLLALLQVRREKWIALIDASTPPSIRFSQLATEAQKIEAELKKPAEGEKK
jgi:hypothetical protein